MEASKAASVEWTRPKRGERSVNLDQVSLLTIIIDGAMFTEMCRVRFLKVG